MTEEQREMTEDDTRDALEGRPGSLNSMSNFDNIIDPGLPVDLVAGMQGVYPAQGFFGRLWYDGTQFCCGVWHAHNFMGVTKRDTLHEIMTDLSEDYGEA